MFSDKYVRLILFSDNFVIKFANSLTFFTGVF